MRDSPTEPIPHPVREATRRSSYRLAPGQRQSIAEQIGDRLDLPMTALGVLALLLVIAEGLSDPSGSLADLFFWSSIALGVIFLGEFVLRVCIAPSTAKFFQKNWWQAIFVFLPFFRFTKVLTGVGRVGRVSSSAIRATRSAANMFTSRIAWLATITAIVILTSGQLLYDVSGLDYGEALHDAALATINGEPIGSDEPLAQTLDVLLGIYAVIIFAGLAASLGAFYIEQRNPPRSVTEAQEVRITRS
jgi:voltage-gated potassium channel